MKTLLFAWIATAFLAPSLSAQSMALEIEAANQALKKDELAIESYQKTVENFKKLVAKESYPELPYNPKTSDLEFAKVIAAPGMKKAEIMGRLHEWIALSYGSLDAVLEYVDDASGKMIVKGWEELYFETGFKWWFADKVRSAKCKHTLVFTVKDEKIRVKVQRIAYTYETGGALVNGNFVPISNYEEPLSAVFPIIQKPEREWKTRFNQMKSTVTAIEKSFLNIENYLLTAPKEDQF